MLWREILRSVFDGIRSNRLRFLLTLSGVIVGSASMVLLSGLLAGGKEALLGASRSASEADLIEVRRRGVPEKQRQRTHRPLNRGDVETLSDSALLGNARVVGLRQSWQVAQWQRKMKNVAVVGTSNDALALYNLKVARGRFFTTGELAGAGRVAVVGHKIWIELFDSASSLSGLEIRAGGSRFPVVGVLARKAQMEGNGPQQWDNRVLIPDSTYSIALSSTLEERRTLDRIFVRLSTVRDLADRIGGIRQVVKSTILRRHYGVMNFRISGEEADAAGEMILLIVSLLIMGTAVISLIVGGINVMNIMLVSITERTREIGVRRAVGAPARLILLQFLAESTVTAALGGIIGVGLGAGLTLAATKILDHLTGAWSFHLVPWAPPLALSAAMLVGVIFGLYPAWRASRLDPVEALRFE
jgi:putative ABC transport system permease protein